MRRAPLDCLLILASLDPSVPSWAGLELFLNAMIPALPPIVKFPLHEGRGLHFTSASGTIGKNRLRRIYEK